MRLGVLLAVFALAMGAALPFEIQAHAENASATTPKRLRADFYPRRDALRIEYFFLMDIGPSPWKRVRHRNQESVGSRASQSTRPGSLGLQPRCRGSSKSNPTPREPMEIIPF